jgi:hypothetical protein
MPAICRRRIKLKVIEHLWEDLAEYLDGAKFNAFRRGFMTQRCKLPALGRSRARRLPFDRSLKK